MMQKEFNEELGEWESLIFDREDTRLRLDQYLSTVYPQYSRRYFQELIADQLVSVNGQMVKKRYLLCAGDEISTYFRVETGPSVVAQEIPLDILFEDEDLIVVNKPAGLVVHPAVGHPSGTFVNALLHHCQSLPEGSGAFRPGIVHRLDRFTSGVMVAAKTAFAHQFLAQQFALKQVKKHYILLCHGKKLEGSVQGRIMRDPRHRQRFCLVQLPDETKGKWSHTDFETIELLNGDCSLVRAHLHTGRTHQIRVHARHLGSPILGDALYGSEKINRKFQLTRQFLHAELLGFTHPRSEKYVEFTAPMPADMREFIDKHPKIT